jgi:hypothetical protein
MGTELHAYRVWAAGEARPASPNFETHARRIAAIDFGQKNRARLPLVVHVERVGVVETFDVSLALNGIVAKPREAH